jgi:hypothetical protein
MPSDSLWVQYSIVGILVLSVGIIASAFYRLWRDLLNWFEVQDSKRNLERDKQRAWQSEQETIRDKHWQEFLRIIRDDFTEQEDRHVEALKQLTNRIEILIVTVNNHDTWERAIQANK